MTRVFFISLLACLNVLCATAEVLTGSCGDNTTYSLDTESGLLKIEGNGAIKNYSTTTIDDACVTSAPWGIHYQYITKAEITDGVTNIGWDAFHGCINLQTVTISNKGDIGWGAFEGCTGLQSATIANQGNVGEYAFYGCTNLQTVSFGEQVKSIGQNAFASCSKLAEIILPNSVTSIGEYAFQNCTSLKNIRLSNTLTAINPYTFAGCTALTQISIPSSVSSIANYAFCWCIALVQITCQATVPPVCGPHTFEDIDKQLCIVKVPSQSLEAYTHADQWMDFAHFEALSQDQTVGVKTINSNTSISTPIYTLSGQRINNVHKGINIVGGRKYWVE